MLNCQLPKVKTTTHVVSLSLVCVYYISKQWGDDDFPSSKMDLFALKRLCVSIVMLMVIPLVSLHYNYPKSFFNSLFDHDEHRDKFSSF